MVGYVRDPDEGPLLPLSGMKGAEGDPVADVLCSLLTIIILNYVWNAVTRQHLRQPVD